MNDAVSAIEKAISALGGLTKATQALAIRNPSVVANWRARGRAPADRVLELERLTGISRHELRPDIFGRASAGNSRSSK